MPNITFTSPSMSNDKTVYAVAGHNGTLLSIAEKNKIKIPFDCQDGECGSCVIKVSLLSKDQKMGSALTDKEKEILKEKKLLTDAEIEDAEVRDIAPSHRLACQYIVRDEDIIVTFNGEAGEAP
ncbi:2Fe-2S iron-sulfur cluster-binding protein [Magnetofaba australis]|uniref:Putative ferredoxin n=1 Tax=Magnetofaba australis IT-1 TaxID=1434232 RepID=A0A1Y2K423_9PROT|nr:2Fe-2S iron-sulfur cluster binding domain-containing protein [Magnetofaba australis]OSM04026.1 putative ferredoxin [Magnetofaba australis IT-1]